MGKSKQLSEGLRFKEMTGLVKPTIHVDEFSSRIGDDDDICVLSFYVRDESCADDLVAWFERGYDFVLDADKSPGEIKPNRYLVYVEIHRRTSLVKHLDELLSDLETLCEYEPREWQIKFREQEFEYNPDTFGTYVPLSPKDYRKQNESGLNEMRTMAGIEPKPIFDKSKDTIIKTLLQQAGY